MLPEKEYRSFRLNNCEIQILLAGNISPHLLDDVGNFRHFSDTAGVGAKFVVSNGFSGRAAGAVHQPD